MKLQKHASEGNEFEVLVHEITDAKSVNVLVEIAMICVHRWVRSHVH